MKRILVTGSNGLLGQNLIELITASGRAELIATSKGANRFPTVVGYTYLDLDITNQSQLQMAIANIKPDVIINTAAITNVDICHTNHSLCLSVNVEAVRNLAEISEKHDIHLIHLSTDFVFDGIDGPYAEDANPNPMSFYGESKYKAEQIILGSSCKWTILRTILVYGLTANMSRSNIVLWAKNSLEKGEAINVVTDQWRMPTLVGDLAEACLLAAEKQATGIFHIAGPELMTVYELVCKVADFWKLDNSLIKPISSAILNQEAKRPSKTGFILDKARNVLDYHPHTFTDGLDIVDKQLVELRTRTE
ncbi:MAG TPA: SDR family oxidoreductase [Pedobacter sp.]|jgi:dTDP-4-dehydrorhamnose reductase